MAKETLQCSVEGCLVDLGFSCPVLRYINNTTIDSTASTFSNQPIIDFAIQLAKEGDCLHTDSLPEP